jgi:hypothetical protein
VGEKTAQSRLGKMHSGERSLTRGPGWAATEAALHALRARNARLLSRGRATWAGARRLGWRGRWAARRARAGLPRLGLAWAAATRGVELG